MDNFEFIIRDTVFKFLTEAENGIIYVDNYPFSVNFDNNVIKRVYIPKNIDIPMLKVKNEAVFLELIKKYILSSLAGLKMNNSQLENYIKQKLIHLFCNASSEDFANIEKHIKKVTDFHYNKIIDKAVISNVEFLDGSDIVIDVIKQSYEMETPYAITFKIQKVINGIINQYDLPNISFGISGDTCYIYSVQHPKNTNNNDNTSYNKKIKRLLYKVNAHLETDFDDDIVAIDKVSPSAIISLSILFSILYNKGINKIEVVPFLPIRYQNKSLGNLTRASYLIKSQCDEYNTDEKKRAIIKEFEEKTNKLQNNLTQKFIMDFLRLEYHFKGITVKSFPQEYSDSMQVRIEDILYTDNKLLSEIVDKTRQVLQNKVK